MKSNLRNLFLAYIVFPVSFTMAQSISGTVTDGVNPLAGAIVRIRATNISDVTDSQGSFTLEAVTSNDSVEVTAAKPGFFNLLKKSMSGTQALTFELAKIPDGDNLHYAWANPAPDTSEKGNCANCHLRIYNEWLDNFHSKSARDPFVLNMYNGTDAAGNPDIGPGYKLDFPNNVGACANCHAPLATIGQPSTIDMNEVSGIDTLGVTCDFCHKIDSAEENSTGSFYGVISIDVKRPPEGTKLLFGPFDDSMLPTGELEFSYSPLFRSSLICAPCHDGSFWGTPAYNTYKEYLESPYPVKGIQCQDCHMKSNELSTRFTKFDCEGGRDREPLLLSTHTLPGAHSDSLLKAAVTLTLSATLAGDMVNADVVIENTNAGHHLPTGHAMRNLILLVTATTDANGDTLQFLNGETVPRWGGEGSPSDGNYAGLPGKGFAKILEDFNERSPSPSWRQTRILQDNRIPATTRDSSTYVFRLPSNSNEVTLNTKLLYRLFFKPVIDIKKWHLQDVVMVNEILTLTVTSVGEGPRQNEISSFILKQNYPNPFNPSTNFRYTIQKASFVTLKIYDLLGQEIQTLVSTYQESGEYKSTWRPHDLASGVYLYRLRANDFLETKKLIFLK